MERNILIILLSVFFTCCSILKDDESIAEMFINIIEEKEEIKASDFFCDIRHIILETKKNAILSEIEKIELFNGLFFIKDKTFEGLFVFDSEGKFVQHFYKQGKGPDEYGSLDDFLIDRIKSSVEVLDKTKKKVFIFDVNTFELVSTISIPFEFFSKFEKNENGYYFQTNGSTNIVDGVATNSNIIFVDKKSLKAKTVFSNTEELNANKWIEFPNVFYKNSDLEIFTSFLWEQSIYQFEKCKVKAILRINNEKGIPNEIATGTYEDKLMFLSSLKESPIRFAFEPLLITKNQIILKYQQGKSLPKPNYFFSLNNNEIVFTTIAIVNDLFYTSVIPFFEITTMVDDLFVFIIYPYQLSETNSFFEKFNVKQTDNPILLTFNIVDLTNN